MFAIQQNEYAIWLRKKINFSYSHCELTKRKIKIFPKKCCFEEKISQDYIYIWISKRLKETDKECSKSELGNWNKNKNKTLEYKSIFRKQIYL